MRLLASENRITGKILVVEDEPVVRNLLAEILTQQGHQVTEAPDGAEALLRIEADPFDLIITDIHMPGIDGLQLTTHIKSRRPSLPVIVLTGYPTLDKAVAAMKQGAVDFLTKPFRIAQVNEMVQKTLRERRLLAQNESLFAEINNKAVIEQLNRQLQQKVTQLTKLYTISESFQSVADSRFILQRIVELASELTDARRVSLMSFDSSRRHLFIRAAVGLPPEVQREVRLEIGVGVAGHVAREARILRVTSKDLAHVPGPHGLRRYHSQSWLSVPVFVGEELFGVLNLTDKSDQSDFTEEDESLVLILVEKAGSKIENNALYEGIYCNLLDTLKTLVSTIEAKDPYTRYHSQRVTETALILAQQVECSEEDRESIAFAGILHDIGKIGIQDDILLKPGVLSHEEYEVIKRHPVISDAILQPLGLIEAERLIVRHHHERIDGAGYPDGLQGDGISFLSRIVSIADAMDAMTSTRSYRKAMPLSAVVAELRANAGKQFDATLVDAAIAAIETGKMAAPSPDASHGNGRLAMTAEGHRDTDNSRSLFFAAG